MFDVVVAAGDCCTGGAGLDSCSSSCRTLSLNSVNWVSWEESWLDGVDTITELVARELDVCEWIAGVDLSGWAFGLSAGASA